MNFECPKFIDHGMPGIIPAVEARHIIHALREKIHHLALALVAPLRADHCCYCHDFSFDVIARSVFCDETISLLTANIVCSTISPRIDGMIIHADSTLQT